MSASHIGQWGASRRPERASGPIDSTVLFVVVTLVLIGVTLVYATTCHKGVAFLKSQGLRAVAGLIALFLGAKLRYTIWSGRAKWALLAGSVALLILTLVIGLMLKGAQRWMQLGPFTFQPAEFTKYALLVWLAGYFDSLKELGKDQHAFWGFVLPGLVVFGVVGLTLLQPAVGTVGLDDLRPVVYVAPTGQGDEARTRAVVVEDLRVLRVEPLGEEEIVRGEPELPLGERREHVLGLRDGGVQAKDQWRQQLHRQAPAAHISYAIASAGQSIRRKRSGDADFEPTAG